MTRSMTTDSRAPRTAADRLRRSLQVALPKPEAMMLLLDLDQALIYAHEHGRAEAAADPIAGLREALEGLIGEWLTAASEWGLAQGLPAGAYRECLEQLREVLAALPTPAPEEGEGDEDHMRDHFSAAAPAGLAIGHIDGAHDHNAVAVCEICGVGLRLWPQTAYNLCALGVSRRPPESNSQGAPAMTPQQEQPPYRPHDCGGCREVGVSQMIDGQWAHRWKNGNITTCVAGAPSPSSATADPVAGEALLRMWLDGWRARPTLMEREELAEHTERPLAATPSPSSGLDFDAMRVARKWPTPNHMRRVADALDMFVIPRYGDVLRWFADRCDENVWHIGAEKAKERLDAARALPTPSPEEGCPCDEYEACNEHQSPGAAPEEGEGE